MTQSNMSESFDFIIVGAGAAGCVLAERLTADGRSTVLLLEAGGSDNRFFVKMPMGYGKAYYDRSLNWMYQAEADPGLANQKDFWPRGKVLGGSSSINAMVYVRGDASDFEDWKAAGNVGWGFDDVLAAYKALEDNETGGDEWRGHKGPLFISANAHDLHPLVKPFQQAAMAAGLPFNADFNGKTQEGVGHYQLTVKNGQRNSAARAFLAPAKSRKNLVIKTTAYATRIVLEGNRATGIEYMAHGQHVTAHARRELIVSAGAVNSPHLLQLSGIGDPSQLKSLGIDVQLANFHVGRNLSDHQGINYTYRATVPTLNNLLRPWWGKLRVGLQYLLFKSGPLSISINQGGGFFRTSPDRSRPNMQLYFQAFSTIIPKLGERPILNPDPFSGMSLGLSNCRPTSRGEIMAISADPLAHPRITANAYSTDHDITEMLEAVKFIRKIAAQQPLARLIAEELRPGPAVQNDDELVADLRLRSGTVYHPSCTCRMGADPATSVVDPKFRVYGLQNLRVVDASAMPSIISGNLNAACMMMGWRGAEMILEKT